MNIKKFENILYPEILLKLQNRSNLPVTNAKKLFDEFIKELNISNELLLKNTAYYYSLIEPELKNYELKTEKIISLMENNCNIILIYNELKIAETLLHELMAEIKEAQKKHLLDTSLNIETVQAINIMISFQNYLELINLLTLNKKELQAYNILSNQIKNEIKNRPNYFNLLYKYDNECSFFFKRFKSATFNLTKIESFIKYRAASWRNLM